MPTVRELHDKAMENLHMGNLEQAYDLESQAARLVPSDNPQAEPTRSILFRSAASLALQLGWYTMGLGIIAEYFGTGGNPPQWVREELEDVEAQLKALIPPISQEAREWGLQRIKELGLA